MQGELYYFTFPTRDLARAKKFFGEALGWQFGEEGGHVVNIGNPYGGIHEQPSGIDAKLWLRVDDVGASVARIRDLGGESTDVIESPSGWSADCKDPDGSAFSIGRMRPEFDEGEGGSADGTGTIRYWTQPVRDITAATKFYAAVFGWQFVEESATYAHVKDSDPACGLMRADGNAPEIWFKTLDTAAGVLKARDLGGSAEEPSESASGTSAACNDDQGMRFNIWQPGQG